jgi:hypothetical protein
MLLPYISSTVKQLHYLRIALQLLERVIRDQIEDAAAAPRGLVELPDQPGHHQELNQVENNEEHSECRLHYLLLPILMLLDLCHPLLQQNISSSLEEALLRCKKCLYVPIQQDATSSGILVAHFS